MDTRQLVYGLDIDNAVVRDVRFGHALHGDDRAVQLFVHVDQLSQRRRIGIDHVVSEHHGERFLPDQHPRCQHRVAESERFALAHVAHIDQVRDLADLFELIELAAAFQKRLELGRHIEVIFDRVLAAAGHQNQVGHA